MANVSQRLVYGRIRFKRGWNKRPVGSTASVIDFGFGVCQTLVDSGRAEWIDEEVQAVMPPTTAGAATSETPAVTETPRGDDHPPSEHNRRRGNGGKRSA